LSTAALFVEMSALELEAIPISIEGFLQRCNDNIG